jgi:hypothetical protein
MNLLTKLNQNRNAAANQQPWRCSGCNTPVRPGMNTPCACTRKLEAEAKEASK